ncbi:MAG: hypothetical protein AB7O97_23410 [Planctomycetota bacterium]
MPPTILRTAAPSALCLALGAGAAAGQDLTARAPATPIEFGRIAWQRDFDAAAATARARGVPRLVLFQEVPG